MIENIARRLGIGNDGLYPCKDWNRRCKVSGPPGALVSVPGWSRISTAASGDMRRRIY